MSDATLSIDSNPTAPTGIDRMMAQLDAAHSSGKPIDTAPSAPESPAPPASPAPAKPEAPTAPAPVPAAAAKPTTTPAPPKPGVEAKPSQPEPDWTKAPPKWHKIYEEHKSKTGETIKSLEQKLKSLESKPFEAPGDAKKIEAYEKQLAELREEAGTYKKRLAQQDFTQTDEYRSKYVEPANQIYKEAIGLVQRLRVKDGDTERAATQADFDYLRSLPRDARRRAANEMFGDNAVDVLDYTGEIDRIRRSATIAAEQHAANNERSALEREGQSKIERQQYDDFRKEALDGIKSNETWGKWFREDEADPEASKLLRESYDEIEKVTAQMDQLPLDQRAAYAALYAARAAATPRLILENNRKDATIAALTEELEKLRGTDPGAAGHGAVTPAANGTPKRMGISEAAALYDEVPR